MRSAHECVRRVEDRHVGRATHPGEELLRRVRVVHGAREVTEDEVQTELREVVGAERGDVAPSDRSGDAPRVRRTRCRPPAASGIGRPTHHVLHELTGLLRQAELHAVRTQVHRELGTARVDLRERDAVRERLVELDRGHEARVLEVAR